MSVTLIVLIVLVVLALALIAVYNGLIRSRVRVDEAWSDITVQLKRRYDLIPNLVNTVKGYAEHESKVFEEVTAARTAAMNATGIAQKSQSENQLEGALKSLFAVSEAYPDLKANEGFQQLQAEITDTEDKIQASRRFYNGSVRDYNIKLQVFPTSLMAGLLGFRHRDFFAVENQAEVEKPVEVKF
ncbi:MAG: LemA family protein [Candidatus Saccharimonadales bacterium]